MVLSGCSTKLYEYDSYEEYIQLGATDSLKIYKSDIEDEIMNEFWKLYSVENDNLTVTTYSSEFDNIYIQKGDTVNINYVGKKSDTPINGGTYNLTIGSNAFIHGFEDGLVGYKIGDTVILKITFPEDELKNTEAVFEVKINSITRTEYPEYNDNNIKKKTSYNTVSEFEEATRKTVINNFLWQKLYSTSKIISYPEAEVKKYYKRYVSEIDENVMMFGITQIPFEILNISLDTENTSDENNFRKQENFAKTMQSKAEGQVKQELIVLSFIEANPEYKLDEESYNAEIEKLYTKNVTKGSFKDFKKQYNRKAFEITIYYDILLNHLREHCVIIEG